MSNEITNIINNWIDKTDWIGHIITCLSVFIGAYFAYIFANRQERQKDKKLESTENELLRKMVESKFKNRIQI